MKTAFKVLACLALCLVALPVFGLMYTAATAPAEASASRQVARTAPITNAFQPQVDALVAEHNALISCLGDPRYSQVRGRQELVNLELALNTATTASSYGDLAQFNTETAIFHTELSALKTRYGC